ncbi:hypothetical protein A2U01_0119245, partial [Trifolium medium]|nr:hypothetical protein [Trifolium medium]
VAPVSGEEDTNVDPLVSENEAPAEDVPPVGSPTIDETPEELPQPETEVPLPPPEAEVPLPAVPNVT